MNLYQLQAQSLWQHQQPKQPHRFVLHHYELLSLHRLVLYHHHQLPLHRLKLKEQVHRDRLVLL